jgi:fumarate hydratase class II
MDATPVTLGQEFGGYAAQVDDGVARLDDTLPRLCVLPLGGTAVGTGINAPKGFAAKVIRRLAARTELPLREAKDHFAAQGARDALVETSGQLRALAVALIKIANDLRWMGSGPHAGLGEIRLPELQPGSSIMPGKVNPVVPEVVTQVGAQVIGNDAAIAFGGAQGNFELNVFVPMMAANLLESIDLLANACRIFADRCIKGVEPNVETLRRYAEASPSIGTALNPYLGYETTADVIKEATRTGKSIRAIVKARKLMTDAELDRALDVEAMTRGGIIE